MLVAFTGHASAGAVRDGSGRLLFADVAPRCDCRLQVAVRALAQGAIVDLSVEGPGVVHRLTVLDGAMPALAGEPASWIGFADGRTMNDLPQLGRDGAATGHGVAALASRSSAIALGATGEVAELEVRVDRGRVSAAFDLGGVSLAAGQRLSLQVVMAGGADLARALDSWSELAHPGSKPRPPRRGWCSWYSQTRPDEGYIRSQLKAARDLGLEVIQVDDGWQRMAGDWQPNERFPSGMADLARRIRAEGLVPGLWLAPFVAAEASAVVRAHPEWLLRDPSGMAISAGDRPEWGGPMVRLDPANPEVVKWLEELARRATHEWGFAYLKLDFLHLGIAAAATGNSTAIQSWRRALLALRQAAAPGTYVLGCDAPTHAAVGLFDATRTGPDSQLGPRRNTASAAAAMQRRFWRHVFTLDPDVVMVRDGVKLDDALARATLPVMLGGAWFSGDVLSALDPERRHLVRASAAAVAPPSTLDLVPGLVVLRTSPMDGAMVLVAANAGTGREVILAPNTLAGRLTLIDPARGEQADELMVEGGSLRLLLALSPQQSCEGDVFAPFPRSGEQAVSSVLWSHRPARCPALSILSVSGPTSLATVDFGP